MTCVICFRSRVLSVMVLEDSTKKDLFRKVGIQWHAWRQVTLSRAAGIPIELPLQPLEETLVRCGLLLAATFVLAQAVEQSD